MSDTSTKQQLELLWMFPDLHRASSQRQLSPPTRLYSDHFSSKIDCPLLISAWHFDGYSINFYWRFHPFLWILIPLSIPVKIMIVVSVAIKTYHQSIDEREIVMGYSINEFEYTPVKWDVIGSGISLAFWNARLLLVLLLFVCSSVVFRDEIHEKCRFPVRTDEANGMRSIRTDGGIVRATFDKLPASLPLFRLVMTIFVTTTSHNAQQTDSNEHSKSRNVS